MRKLLSFLILVSLNFQLSAQSGWEAGANLGVSHYFGDLNTTLSINEPGLSAGLIGRYLFNPRVGIQFGAFYNRIGADDKNSDNPFEKTRNLNFESHVIGSNIMLEFNFLNYVHGSQRQRYTPYLALGFGVHRFNPRTTFQGEKIALNPLGTEGQTPNNSYSLITGSLSYAIGFKYNLNYYWSLNFQLSSHRVLTDYLDDVSQEFVDPQFLERQNGPLAALLADRSGELGEDLPPLAVAGRQRGNSKDNDNYTSFGISLVYWFGDVRCPPINRNIHRDR